MECKTEVLIVGAGPTGMSAAIALLQAGVQVLVIDAQRASAHTSRAAVVHAATLEALAPLGVTARLAAIGIEAPLFTIRDRDRVLLRLDFSHLPTPYPYALMVSQADTERVLLERLQELGGEVLRPRVLRSLTQDAAGVTATLDDGSTVRASYAVGADGLHSTVREQAGIAFDGHSYPETFALADVRMASGFAPGEVRLHFSPAGMVVVAPLPDQAWRIVATLDSAAVEAEAAGILEVAGVPQLAFLQGLLDQRGPRACPVLVEKVIWGSRFHVHHRIAARYRAQRIFLAGDAAHVHSPAGGQGMNTGIQDAVLLGALLAGAVRRGDVAPLAAYEQARRPVALRVMQLADRLTRLATMGSSLRTLRNIVLWLLGRMPPLRHALSMQISGLVYRRAGPGQDGATADGNWRPAPLSRPPPSRE